MPLPKLNYVYYANGNKDSQPLLNEDRVNDRLWTRLLRQSKRLYLIPIPRAQRTEPAFWTKSKAANESWLIRRDCRKNGGKIAAEPHQLFRA